MVQASDAQPTAVTSTDYRTKNKDKIKTNNCSQKPDEQKANIGSKKLDQDAIFIIWAH